jgi:hypothetical protein
VSTCVYITRRLDDNPLESDGEAISAEEWRSAVARDPEMQLHTGGALKWFPPHAVIARWSPYGPDPDTGLMAWMHGNIEVNDPDDRLLRKMGQLAEALGAALVTENGEQFGLDGSALGFLDWSEFK